MYTPMDGETKQNKTVSKMTGNLFCSNVRKKHRNSSSFFSPFLVNPQQSENFEDFNFWKKRISPLFFYNSENMPHTRALGQQMARGVSPIRDDAFVLGDVHHLFFFFFSSSLVRAAVLHNSPHIGRKRTSTARDFYLGAPLSCFRPLFLSFYQQQQYSPDCVDLWPHRIRFLIPQKRKISFFLLYEEMRRRSLILFGQ